MIQTKTEKSIIRLNVKPCFSMYVWCTALLVVNGSKYFATTDSHVEY